jgi:hypothetical protein
VRRTAFARPALLAALSATAIVLGTALLAGALRIIPWLVDPDVPPEALGPFVRGALSLSVEAALLVGWPLGWCLTAERAVTRGEWSAVESLGERADVAALRLLPQLAAPALVLTVASMVWARDTHAPGLVARELVMGAGRACAEATSPETLRVPVVEATWLCAPGQTPRVFLRGPGGLRQVLLTATDLVPSGDLRAVELTDVHVATTNFHLQAGKIAVRGLQPFVGSDPSAPWARMAALVLSLTLTAWLAFREPLRGALRGRLSAVLTGASGPLVALFALRALERTASAPWAVAVPPLLGALALLVAARTLPAAPRAIARLRYQITLAALLGDVSASMSGRRRRRGWFGRG